MSLIYTYDTETSGLPQFKLPSSDPSQPHLVDIAALLYTEDGTLVDSFEAIIRPDGWTIPDEVAAIHGITTEMAMDMGIPESEALDGFMAIHERASLRVAHNRQFDDRIMRIALMRYRDEEAAEQFKAATGFCTMNATRDIIKLPPTARMRGGFKPPKLSEAYKYFTGQDLEGAHRARADAEGCALIYFALQAQESALEVG